MAKFIQPIQSINAVTKILANQNQARQKLVTSGTEGLIRNPIKHLIGTFENGGVSPSALKVANECLSESNRDSINLGDLLLTSVRGVSSFLSQCRTYIEPVPKKTTATTKALQGR